MSLVLDRNTDTHSRSRNQAALGMVPARKDWIGGCKLLTTVGMKSVPRRRNKKIRNLGVPIGMSVPSIELYNNSRR